MSDDNNSTNKPQGSTPMGADKLIADYHKTVSSNTKIEPPKPFSNDELNAYITGKDSDPRVIATIMHMLNEINKKVTYGIALNAALAMLLKSKFGPVRVYQSEINKLPPGWDISLSNTDDDGSIINDGFIVRLKLPLERSEGGILLHSQAN